MHVELKDKARTIFYIAQCVGSNCKIDSTNNVNKIILCAFNK